jgi:hypothetical protein
MGFDTLEVANQKQSGFKPLLVSYQALVETLLLNEIATNFYAYMLMKAKADPKVIYLDKFGSTTLGKLSKLRRTQSIPTSLFSLIF